MSNPGNETTSQMNESYQPGQQPGPMKSATNPPPPTYATSPSTPYQDQPYNGPPMQETAPSMPYPYQPHAGPGGAIFMQPQQTVLVTNVQIATEQDYLGYSIFTLLCCCFPLGIAALIYSLRHQPYAGPPDAGPTQSQQTIFVRNVKPVNEPAYLGYSIFTLLCCCPPLGIAGLIYSLRTQKANRRRDITSAKKYSRLALTLDNIALGLGIATIVLSIIGVSISNIIAHNADQQ
ncbi:proline-rich transmembrane protein 1-like [Erythrolamprus reginae]|uniref:proline-rich transmembrane protein 1-like n=1 Tax=Erythrolamprus reginae TaxID=121349 RepID=UPI00396CE4E2